MNWKPSNTAETVDEWIMSNLGVSSTDEINQWFIKSRECDYKISNLKEAVALLEKNKEKPIVICGDYDADGVMAVSILMIALKLHDFDVHFMIPHRHTEGYGLNMRMITEIKDQYSDVCLVTVDNGIVAFDEIEKAKEYGWDVLVTDHHIGLSDDLGNPILPKADVVMNPAFLPNTADFAGYCGAGLAYRIAVELLGYPTARFLMPLAMIATFADVMPLKEENYVFARDGLRFLNAGIAPKGLLALVNANRLEKIEDSTVLFQIAPQINAPGRLKPNGAEECVNLILENDKYKGTSLANQVILDNDERKRQVANVVGSIVPSILLDEDIVVQYIPNINPGIVGIIAGQVTEKTKRPSIIVTDSYADADMLVGSCRSVNNVHIKHLLDEVSDFLEFYGGHAGAAGVSIKRDKWQKFQNAIIEALNKKNLVFMEQEEAYYDFEIANKNIRKVIDDVSKFAPFGEGNPKPVFKVTDFVLVPDKYGNRYRELAKDGIKFTSFYGNAIAFGVNGLCEEKLNANTLNFYGTLSLNHFRGVSTPQIEFMDLEVKQ